MDGSDQKSNSSSSNSNKHRPPIPKDENGKMMTSSKHFMSPTISAASKFNPSRKKILAERNESVENNLPKTPNLDSKRVEKETNSDPNRNSGVWKSVSGDSSSSKPYDPITNYLSPRPRFLRYDPNRRRQILLRSGNEEKQGENEDAGDCASSCDSLAQPQGGDDEIDETDSEYEEEEEDDERRGCWSFRGVFKVLMLLLVLVVSTLYISSMNSPTPSSSSSPVVVAVPGIRYGYHYHMMQDHGYEYANRTFLQFEREEERIVELDGGQIQGFSNSEVTEEENEEGEGGVDEEIVEEEEEIIELDGGRIEGFSDSEMEGEVETFSEAIEDEKIVEEEEIIVELVDGGKIPDSSNSQVSETVDEPEKEGFVEEPIKEGIFESERGRIGNVTEGGGEMIKGIETESVLKAVIGFSMVFFLSALIASVALLRRFHSRKSRNGGKKNTSPPVVPEPCFEPAEPIESGGGAAAAHFGISETMSLINSMEEEASEATRGRSIRSLSHGSCRKSLTDSMEEEASREEYLEFIRSLSHESRAAPVIELLGELELSEMSTSYGVGTKNSSRVIENEVSSSHISYSKTISYPARVSTFDSPSYPDQKTQQPMKKKKEGDATTTPVRRSNRIRNQAFSP